MKIHIVYNGRIIHTVIGMRSKTPQELYERVMSNIVLRKEE